MVIGEALQETAAEAERRVAHTNGQIAVALAHLRRQLDELERDVDDPSRVLGTSGYVQGLGPALDMLIAKLGQERGEVSTLRYLQRIWRDDQVSAVDEPSESEALRARMRGERA